MSPDEMIDVIRAREQGLTVQCRERLDDHEPWDVMRPDEEFDFVGHDYRIAPRPREWWMRSHRQDKKPCTLCGFFESKETAADRWAHSIFHVREVIE